MRLMIMSNNNKFLYCGVLFLIVFLFSWWSNPSLNPNSNLGDTPGYLSIAKDFSAPQTEIRPFFFPLIIRFCMNISEINWDRLFSLFQILFHSLICVLIFRLYLTYNFDKVIAFILTLLIGFNPSIIYWSTYLMPDFILAVLTTLAWLCTIIFIQKDDEDKKKKYYLILIGIFSGLAFVTKPISILGIVPLLFTYIVLSKKSLYMLKTVIIILIINYSFHFSWEKYKSYNNSGTSFELLDFLEFPINMTAIRGGLVDYGEGMPLYDLLEERKLLDTARQLKIKLSYTMDEDPNYLRLYKALKDDWDTKNDKEFAKQILAHAPTKLFFYSISNWHAFFTKRCFGPGDGSFPGMPDTIRYLYIVGYSVLYRPFLLILLLFSFFILLKRNLMPLLYSSVGLILYASLTIALLTPHGGEFPRYRVWVEYIMWFCALIPVGYIIQFLLGKLKRE